MRYSARISSNILAAVLFMGLLIDASASDIDLGAISRSAISSNEELVVNSIAPLRSHGPIGLEALLTEHSAIRDRGQSHPNWHSFSRTVDAVAMQRDAHASQLYWYSDFEEAKKTARASNKPILSLRLLGNLDEEYSCANSRFFRTVLYANQAVSKHLRESFVLHWKSVRPVPRITIDFGNGRKLERTVTGNSIHYILDPDGRAVDALPGLYGPAAFLRGIERAEVVMRQCMANLLRGDTDAVLHRYHCLRISEIDESWAADLRAIGVNIPQGSAQAYPPAAEYACKIVPTGPGAGRPSLYALSELKTSSPAVVIDDEAWAKIAALHIEDAELDRGSKALMQSKHTSASLLPVLHDRSWLLRIRF